MASVTMDNPLSPSPQTQLKKVVQDLNDCVAGLQREFEDSGCPITDDSPTLHRFCAKLESLLHTGFKGKTSLFGEKKDYWNYFVDCIGSTKDLRDGIKFVKANTELRTSLGRGRAFLRFTLVHQRLADTIQQCVCSTKQTNDWYHGRAVWLQPVLYSAIINTLYDLNDLQFDLLPRGYDLDTTWPTFARKTFGSPQSWASPPSRSTSISSLASIPALEIPLSPSAHSASHNNSHTDQLSQELNDSENERFSLQVKLESLKETKEMASNRVEELETKVKTLQTACNEFEVQNETLKNQLKLKDSTWAEVESGLKSQIEQADQNMADLRNQIANGSSVGMSIAELMTKLAIQQKKNATLQIELKTSQLELTSKTQTDNSKTKLIEMLDKKIEQLQGQNQRMLVTIESCAADRTRDAEGSKSSHNLIEATMDRLKRADAINAKLQEANEALRKMLETMEEKTTKISTMAKEKLTLYKTENTKLQLTVQQLSKQLARIKAAGPGVGQDAGEVPAGEVPAGEAEAAKATEAAAAEAAAQAIENTLADAKKDIDMWKAKYDEVHAELEKAKTAPATPAERSEDLVEKDAAGESTAKLMQLGKEKEHTAKALARSREEVKKVLIEKMHVEEEATMVAARQQEVQATHQQLLVQLAHTETAVRKLEAEIATIKDVVEAGEAHKEGPQDMHEKDTPLVAKVKALVVAKLQVRAQLQNLDVQNISLRKDLETKEKQVEELDSEILSSQLQIAELKTLHSKSEVECADMAAKLEEYKSISDDTDSKDEEQQVRQNFLLQIESKENQIAELQTLLQEHKQKYEEEKLTTSSNEGNDALAKLEAESKLKEYRVRYDFLMEEKVILETKCRDLETKLKTTKQNLKKVDKENKKLLSERENLRKEVESLKGQVESLTQTNESLSTQLIELESAIMKSVEDKLTSLQNNLETEQKGRKKLESDLEHLRTRNQGNEKLLQQLQEKKQSDEAKYKSNLQKKEEQFVSVRRERDLLENKLTALSSQYDDATTRDVNEREEFKMEIDLLQCDLQKGNDDLEAQRLHVQETEKVLINSFLELLGVDFSAENPGMQVMAMQMTTNLKDTQKSMSEKSLELENAQQRMETNLKTIEQLKEAALQDSTLQNNLQTKLTSADNEVTSLQGQLLQSSSNQEQLETLLAELKETSSSSHTQWAIEKETLNKNIAELTVEAGGILEQTTTLQQKLSEQEEELSQTQSQKEQLESNITDLRESFSVSQSQWEDEKDTLMKQVTELSEEGAVKVQQIAALQEKLKQKDDEASDGQFLQQQFQSTISELKESLAASQSQGESEKESFTKRIAELTEDGELKVNEITSLQKNLRERDEELSDIQSIQKQLKLTITELEESLATSQSQLDSEKENLNQKITELIKEAAGKLAEIAILQQKVTEQEVQLQNMDDEGQKQNVIQEKLNQKDAELVSVKETLQQQKVEFCSVKEDLQQELSALRFELSSQQMEHQQALQEQGLEGLRECIQVLEGRMGSIADLGLEGHAGNIADLVSKLTAQETLIEMLEKDLELLKRERLLEKNRTLNELEELRQSLSGRDEECKLLNGELKRTSMLLDEERNLSLRFKNELGEIQAYYDKELSKSRNEVDLLRKDSEVLKQQLIKIIKDKDALWQKTDKLEYLQKLTVAGSWMDDTTTTNCLACNATFSFMLRKHHCRLCGRIFCYNCCNQWVKTPHSSKRERICNDCCMYHKTETERFRDGMPGQEEDDNEAADQDEPPPTPQNTDQSSDPADNPSDITEDDRAPSSFLPEEESDDGLVTMQDPLLSPRSTLSASLQPVTLGVSPAVDAALTTPDGDPESSVATGTQADTASSPMQRARKDKKGAHQSDTDADDEFYDVITQEEIVQSMHESMIEADSHTLSSPMLTVEQIASGQVPEDPALCVRAGKAYQVPVFIDAPGIVLCWDFSTEPKGIHFSVTFRRDALTSNDLAEVLIPLCPCNSHRQAIQGELIAVKPGLYTLIFDNSTSRFTSKMLNYRLHVKKPEAAD